MNMHAFSNPIRLASVADNKVATITLQFGSDTQIYSPRHIDCSRLASAPSAHPHRLVRTVSGEVCSKEKGPQWWPSPSRHVKLLLAAHVDPKTQPSPLP